MLRTTSKWGPVAGRILQSVAIAVASVLVGSLPARADDAWRIRGHVKDEKGRPVQGASAIAEGFPKFRAESKTDAQGRFDLAAPAETSSVAVAVRDATNARLWVQRFYLAEARQATELDVVLAPAREITVEVVDGEDRAVEGAVVLACEQHVDVSRTRSRKDGSTTVRLPCNAKTPIIYALKPGAGYDYFSALQRAKSNLPTTVDPPSRLKLTLDGAQTIRVQAVDSRGRPVAGVFVEPWYVNRANNPGDTNFSGSDEFRAKTGTDGVAEFDWLPTDIKYGVTFMCKPGNFCTPCPLTVMVKETEGDHQLRLLQQTALSGRAVLPNGEPAAGIRVRASGEGVAYYPDGTVHGGSGEAITGLDGRYQMLVYPEQAYIVAVDDERWAAHKVGVVVREGKPATDVELQLAPGAVIQGKVTRGPKKVASAGEYVSLRIEGGGLPEEIEQLRRPDDRRHHELTFSFSKQTDADGRFRFAAAPGEYLLWGPVHAEPARLTVTDQNEIIHDFHLPQAEEIPFSGVVVDPQGKPLVEATLVAYYASSRHRGTWFETETNTEGRFEAGRESQPMMVRILSKDGKFGLIVKIDGEQTDFRFTLPPTATVRGRLLDAEGEPTPGKNVSYTVRVHQGDDNAPWVYAFRGSAQAGSDGCYLIRSLPQGVEWHVGLEQAVGPLWKKVKLIVPESVEEIDLGHTRPIQPHVPLTLEQLIARQFRISEPLAKRLANAKREASRERLRIMLVLADPKSDLAKQLYSVLRDRSNLQLARAGDDYQGLWVAATSTNDVQRTLMEMGLELEGLKPPAIAVLDADGAVLGSASLSLDDGQLDKASLENLLVEHMLSEPDAEQLLASALTVAKNDGKRVFLQETASWCGPCRLLSRYIERNREVFDANYVWIKIDRERQVHGADVMNGVRSERKGGIPWVAILDAEGKELGVSETPEGENYAFPSEPDTISQFIKLLKATAPRLDEEQAARLEESLTEAAAQSN